jgi:DNA-directed RNA polymerase subunit RPC12/RpoP
MTSCFIEQCSLYVNTASREESEKIIKAFENTDFSEHFDLHQEEATRISITWEDVTDGDKDEVLEDFNKWLGKEYNCTLCGHIIVEVDGIKHRGEMIDGRMEYESSDWLLELPLNEIHRLYNLRRESPWEYVELHCEHCGHAQPVVADAEYTHYASAAVVYYPNGSECGDVGLNWSDMDVEMDFVYHCAKCGKILACDLEEVLKKYEKERKGE